MGMRPWELWFFTSDESCSTAGTHKSGVCSRGDATEGMEKTPETHHEPTPRMRGTYVLTHAAVRAAIQQPCLPLACPRGSRKLGLVRDHMVGGHCQHRVRSPPGSLWSGRKSHQRKMLQVFLKWVSCSGCCI